MDVMPKLIYRETFKVQHGMDDVELTLTVRKFIHVEHWKDGISVWYELGTDEREHRFVFCWTGDCVPSRHEHIGSCIDRESGLVWHVYHRILY